MSDVTLTEADGTISRTPTGRRRYRARLIEGDRWGSSGYYPADVLGRDGPKVWPEGTLMYLDHPSLSETVERPERSVRDLAGRIASTPTYQSDGLYADVEVFPHMQPVVDGLAETIGLSIRARGTAEQGEAAGRSGPVITSLTEGSSVDFVTQAGAGGQLVQLLESARQDAAPVPVPAAEPAGEEPATTAEAMRRVHEAATKTNTKGDGTPPAATTETEGGAAMPEEQADTSATGGTGVSESAVTRQIVLGEAARLNELLVEARTAIAETNKRAEVAEARATAAEHRALVVEAKHAAEKQARAALAASPLTEASHQGVVDAVCDSLTVNEAGKTDDKALAEAITAEIDKAARREAAILEAHGAGIPKGLGASVEGPTEQERIETRTARFTALGMTESAAKLAANGTTGGRF